MLFYPFFSFLLFFSHIDTLGIVDAFFFNFSLKSILKQPYFHKKT
ncbi:hypothetical protein HMPREF0216_02733 [Clostridium celatum DSM 1785]|uniref:Uncharacterized protein n=1 Tax=Clostridium celatum DSM 1785 TaxID=545697 RepID=L1Q8A8_9CLOT|nr:hypothetical protein HMPREF0216_02733 [Clostridium celatum DSM 1785]